MTAHPSGRPVSRIHVLLAVQSIVVILVSINRLTSLTTGYVLPNEFLRWVDLNNMLVLPLVSVVAFYLLKKHIEQAGMAGRWHWPLNIAFIVGIYLLAAMLLLVSFDPILAQTLRLPGETLRITLLVLLTLTIVIGVQAVGIVLVAAMLVTPAATARFYVRRMHHLMALSAAIAVFSGIAGMYVAWHGRVAASAAIVLTMTVPFMLSYTFAPGKGYVWALLGRTARTV